VKIVLLAPIGAELAIFPLASVGPHVGCQSLGFRVNGARLRALRLRA
jgi:hypothetical protein